MRTSAPALCTWLAIGNASFHRRNDKRLSFASKCPYHSSYAIADHLRRRNMKHAIDCLEDYRGCLKGFSSKLLRSAINQARGDVDSMCDERFRHRTYMAWRDVL